MSTTTQASISTPSFVAQIGTGECVVKVSESPGVYYSFGRGRSTRLYRMDGSAHSLARVNVGPRSCSAANSKWMDKMVKGS